MCASGPRVPVSIRAEREQSVSASKSSKEKDRSARPFRDWKLAHLFASVCSALGCMSVISSTTLGQFFFSNEIVAKAQACENTPMLGKALDGGAISSNCELAGWDWAPSCG